jgi:hypothetical protein
MEKIKRRVRPNQVAFDYPTMTEDEPREFPVCDALLHPQARRWVRN